MHHKGAPNDAPKNLRQYRIIQVCGLHSKIFRQVVQINQGKADALLRFFGQADGIIFKQAVRLELCGVALMFCYAKSFLLSGIKPSSSCISIIRGIPSSSGKAVPFRKIVNDSRLNSTSG